MRSVIIPSRPALVRPRRLLDPATPAAREWTDARILSREESEALFKRVVALTSGGGDTQVTVRATWTANLRWGRNRPTTSGNTVEQQVVIARSRPNGEQLVATCDRLDDVTLKAAVQQIEQQLSSSAALATPPEFLGPQAYETPQAIWNEATYQLTPHAISEAAHESVRPVVAAKLMAAGYVEASAVSWAIFNTRGLAAYAAATGALYTETVRMPDGSGSGWVGKSHYDWTKLDVPALAATALQKCRDSAHPFKIEPGRYTAILEPDVVGQLVQQMFFGIIGVNWPEFHGNNGRTDAEGERDHPFHLAPGKSKIGQQIFDSRMTITSDPTDPECGYIPFDRGGNPYHKVTWVENGVLKELAYNRDYARQNLGTDIALPNPMAFRMSGGETSIEEMIATTERGIYVTRLGLMSQADFSPSLAQVSFTRDGLWLIERGKIVHPIKNLWIYDSPLIAFNQVLQLGPPVRTLGHGMSMRVLPAQALNDGHTPSVMPPLKVKDFNFTRLIDAI